MLMTPILAAVAQNSVPGRLIWHARLSPDHLEGHRAGISWADSMLFCVEVPPPGQDSPEYGFEAGYYLMCGDSVLTQGTFTDHYPARNPGMSIKLHYREGRANIEAGAKGPCIRIPVDFDPARHSPALYNPSNLKVKHLSVVSDTIPAPQYAPVAHVDSLTEAIRRSGDANAAVWRYLDRDNNASMAVCAGNYTIATYPDGHGGYVAVYLDGAQRNKDAWQPLRIKAYLGHTPFANHYNLRWLDAYGRPAPQESYATIDSATGIMTVVFPLLETTIRFQRLP